jgi:hypothetical protein
MSAVDVLRAKAERLAAQLRDAEGRALAEAGAVKARNDERRQAFWTKVHDEELREAAQAVQDARTAFSEAVADGGSASGAYVTYVKAYAAHKSLHNAVAAGLVSYVDEVTGKPNEPGDRRGRPVYPGGLYPVSGDPAEFVALFQEAAADVATAHADATVALATAPLRAELEPEGD